MKSYIGDLKEFLEVEYAKSNRSTCRKCKEHIDKDELRVGIHFDDEKFSTDNWFHLGCFQFKPRHKVLNPSNLENHIEGIRQLKSKDYRELMNTLKADFQELENKPPKTKPLKSYEKQGRYDKSSENILPKNQEAEIKKKRGKRHVKMTKKPKEREVLTDDQKQEYERLIEYYDKFTVHELRDILEKNDQVKVGKKHEMAERCADGKQFGRIPPCPKCGGGKLRFDRDHGLYYCPGYMQDTDFVHCDGKFNFDDVERTKWIE